MSRRVRECCSSFANFHGSFDTAAMSVYAAYLTFQMLNTETSSSWGIAAKIITAALLGAGSAASALFSVSFFAKGVYHFREASKKSEVNEAGNYNRLTVSV